MAKRRTIREFVGLNDAKSRTARVLRNVADELERMGVRWRPSEDENSEAAARQLDLASWVAFWPRNGDYKTVKLHPPHGEGWLLIHRAILEG